MSEPDVYQDVITAFEDEYDVELEPPDLEVDLFRVTVEADPDSYTLELGPLPYAYMDRDGFREQVHGAICDLYDAALETAVEEHIEEIAHLYADIDPTIKVRNQFFEDLNEDDEDSSDRAADRYTNGKYSSLSQTIRIDDKFLDDINPRTHEVQTSKLDGIIRHECLHGLHYGTNPHLSTLSDHISDTSEDYTKDVRRASIEAITRFEQYRIDDWDRDDGYRELHDPWKVPDVFATHTDMDEYGNDLFDSPYKLGHFTAHAIDAAFQNEYGKEEGRGLTREFLVRCVTTPTGLTGAIEASFNMRGLPYYPDRVQVWEDWLSRRDNPEEHVHDMYKAGRELLETAETTEQQITYFYDLHALFHVAESSWLSDDMLDWFENV